MPSVDEIKIHFILNFVFSAVITRISENLVQNLNPEELIKIANITRELKENEPSDLIIKIMEEICNSIINIANNCSMTDTNIIKKTCENLKIETSDIFSENN